MQNLLTDLTSSMSDFKKNPAKVLRDAGAWPVAVLNRNKAAFYIVDPELLEALIDEVEDAQLLPQIKARIASAARGKFTEVDIDSVQAQRHGFDCACGPVPAGL
jgi:antitoxin StbD